MKKMLAALFSSALVFAGMAGSASAQPIVTGGLVNITVTDVLTGDILSENEVNLGVALNLAANICDVNVNVLATQLRNGGATCRTAEQIVEITQTN